MLQGIRSELVGWVAEARAPQERAPRHCTVRVARDDDDPEPAGAARTQIVGTVSVSRYLDPRRSGWLHALAVHPG